MQKQAPCWAKARTRVSGRGSASAPHYLARIMLPYVFGTVNVEELIRLANAFIRNMCKDTPFWEEFPLFEIAGLDPWTEPRLVEVTEFCCVLRTLPLATREHFFDFVSRSDTRVNRKPSVGKGLDCTTRIAEKSLSIEPRVRNSFGLQPNPIWHLQFTSQKSQHCQNVPHTDLGFAICFPVRAVPN